MITPTIEQIELSKTWTELFKLLEINPRNDRTCKKIKDWVREHHPNSHLERYRGSYSKVSDQTFTEAVRDAVSVRDALKRCGLNAVGAAYTTFKRRVEHLGLDTSHFLGMAACRGRPRAVKSRPLSYYLTKNGPYITSYSLKLRLLKEDLKESQCEICHTSEWMGKPAPLQLDHKNGDNRDNTIENLRILCAMCHAQTDNFAVNKNRKPKKKCPVCGIEVRNNDRLTCGSQSCINTSRKDTLSKQDRRIITRKPFGRKSKECPVCLNKMSTKHKHCSYQCAAEAHQKVNWSSVDILEELKTKNYSQLGRELGVSDNAIRKQLKKIMVAPVGFEPTL